MEICRFARNFEYINFLYRRTQRVTARRAELPPKIHREKSTQRERSTQPQRRTELFVVVAVVAVVAVVEVKPGPFAICTVG